jgi:alditol oxidase
MHAFESNWAGSYTYSADIQTPHSVAAIQDLVRRAATVRALGSRHSFNRIADSSDTLISLARLDRVTSLDRTRRTVTIEGGVRYGRLGAYLHQEGFALHNMASLPHISVAGACATATHGSGERNGNLATAVAAMEIVAADGGLVTVSRETHGEDFNGMVVSIGMLGVITSLTLDVIPTFDVRQDVYENLTLAALDQHFDAIQASAYSVSLFTDWQHQRFNQVWLKRIDSDSDIGSTFFGATRATANLHPIPGISGDSCTPQMGVAGAWCDRLPHFRMDFTPSSGQELQSEYFVPRADAVAALRAIMALGDRIAPHLLVSEVRTIAADDLWMSPCYGQPSVAIHFTWRQNWLEVQSLLSLIEAALAPFNARPHWGKLFTMLPERVRDLYPRLSDFQRLLRAHDPNSKFHNAFVDAHIFGAESA